MLQAGRYENPEENPFFPDDLPPSMVPTHDYKQVTLPTWFLLSKIKTSVLFLSTTNLNYRFCILQALPLM